MEPETTEQQEDKQMEIENRMELKNIPLSICFEENRVEFDRGTFQFDEEAFQYSTDSANLNFRYQDTTSFGTYQLQLIIYLKDPDAENEEAELNHELFDLIIQAVGLKKNQHFNMCGPYEISIDFSVYGKETLTEVYNKLNQFSAMNDDDEDMDFSELDQMITADDIDEHGNIINNKDGSD